MPRTFEHFGILADCQGFSKFSRECLQSRRRYDGALGRLLVAVPRA